MNEPVNESTFEPKNELVSKPGSFISAHVLDAGAGRPAAGVGVRLTDSAGAPMAESVTDNDGRVGDLGPELLPPGNYQVIFATGDYYARQNVRCFHPTVSVLFTVDAAERHYHIPLLLSPFSYTTYRGS